MIDKSNLSQGFASLPPTQRVSSRFTRRVIVSKPLMVLLFSVLLIGVVAAQYGPSYSGSSSRYSDVNYNNRNYGFDTYYSGSQMDDYWPILGDPLTCKARQDLILNVAPFGCEPAVVRSDLLAEQNVPVFCQIDALKLNPLIDVDQIRNVRFTGDYPPEVAGSGFHPARAALRTHDRLLGDPLINNVGYVVVVLKKQPDESLLPEFVNVTLLADVEYVSGNALGIGRSEFVLEPVVSDDDWKKERVRQSFWNGRYFVRLEHVDSNYADVAIYSGDKKVTSQRVEKGKTSPEVFLPGAYCQVGLEISYNGFVSADDKARIEVISGNDVDVFDVYKNTRFLDGRCAVRDVFIGDDGDSGKVTGNCDGQNFVLELVGREGGSFEGVTPNKTEDKYLLDLSGKTELNVSKRGIYYLNSKNELIKTPKVSGQEIIVINSSGVHDSTIIEEDKDWFDSIKIYLSAYKQSMASNPNYQAGGFKDRENEGESRNYVVEAIDSYEEVAEDYPNEPSNETKYGERALSRAVDLAELFGMENTKARLLNSLLEIYPESGESGRYLDKLNEMGDIDSSKAVEVVYFDDKTRAIRLLSLDRPRDKAGATFSVQGNSQSLKIDKGKTKELDSGGMQVGNLTVDDVDEDSVRVGAYCRNDEGRLGRRESFTLRLDGNSVPICGLDVRLSDVNSEKLAKVSLNPRVRGTESKSNFTFSIGIEKRNIELTPDEALAKIDDLNETIEKWEEISEDLGEVVEGMKGACLAVSGLLTFKNFLSGLNGETLARQQVMGYWNDECADMEYNGKTYDSVDQCYISNGGEIEGDVAERAVAIKKANDQIAVIQKPHTSMSGLGSKSVDSDKTLADLAKYIRDEYKNIRVNTSEFEGPLGEKDEATAEEIFSVDNVNDRVISNDIVREFIVNMEMRGRGTEGLQERTEKETRGLARRVNDKMELQKAIDVAKANSVRGWADPFYSESRGTRAVDIVKAGDKLRADTGNLFDGDLTHSATFVKGGKKHILGMQVGDVAKGTFDTKKIYIVEDGKLMDKANATKFISENNLDGLKDSGKLSYNNKMAEQSKVVKYYEIEPYKGMPAIVPFDSRQGWYAATRPTLPAFGGIGAFDASGRVTSFWLCNVGENTRIEFESGMGDDLCQMINLNTGQPLGSFPGLSESEARNKVDRAVRAISDAARQYSDGVGQVNILGETFNVGRPMAMVSGTDCYQFMPAKDCHLMFNVCDPVICPPSRCDLGGKHPVADVVQTGIVGSVFLCLPNIREGIVMPVCLTGIHAGIDGWTSIMRNYRDCLQENVETGRMVGICDQIYSVYMCEFFWGQVAPFVDVIIPNLISSAYGQGSRGGAEYLTVNAAWQNMENSVNYFTNTYAVNSLEAFGRRTDGKYGSNPFLAGSVEQIGTEFCKSSISVSTPTAFESIIEADSPPQFHAWFDQKTFTTATVPATAQYKVFYHIFAGKDSGAHFSVYLRSPPGSSYYSSAPTVMVDSGFIPFGEYASETKDFTAPEGYKELCVRIDDMEECGFGQVSTSFAVDYLRDSYVSDEALNDNIQSEEECISGGHDPRALLQPNVQAGADEFINPAIYDRGIVRICSTNNPGSKTDPTRFLNVGNCGDPKIVCWLDKSSVEDAIEMSGIFEINESLSELEVRTRNYLEGKGEIYDDRTANLRLNELQRKVNGLESAEDKIEDGNEILGEISEMEDMFFYNHHKAKLLLLKGDVNRIMAGMVYAVERGEVVKANKGVGEVEEMCLDGAVVGEGGICYDPDLVESIDGPLTDEDKAAAEVEVPRDSGGEDSDEEAKIWGLDDAVAKAGTLSGRYSYNEENRKFVDELYDPSGLISKKEYEKINGFLGLNQKDMGYVFGILKEKAKAREEVIETLLEEREDYDHVPENIYECRGPNNFCLREDQIGSLTVNKIYIGDNWMGIFLLKNKPEKKYDFYVSRADGSISYPLAYFRFGESDISFIRIFEWVMPEYNHVTDGPNKIHNINLCTRRMFQDLNDESYRDLEAGKIPWSTVGPECMTYVFDEGAPEEDYYFDYGEHPINEGEVAFKVVNSEGDFLDVFVKTVTTKCFVYAIEGSSTQHMIGEIVSSEHGGYLVFEEDSSFDAVLGRGVSQNARDVLDYFKEAEHVGLEMYNNQDYGLFCR